MLYSQRFCRLRRKGCFCFPDAKTRKNFYRLHIERLEASPNPSFCEGGKTDSGKQDVARGHHAHMKRGLTKEDASQ